MEVKRSAGIIKYNGCVNRHVSYFALLIFVFGLWCPKPPGVTY